MYNIKPTCLFESHVILEIKKTPKFLNSATSWFIYLRVMLWRTPLRMSFFYALNVLRRYNARNA